MSENVKSIYQQAVEKFGDYFQINMALEECAEFVVAINKYRRATEHEEATKRAEEVCDEIADVIIMMEQMQLMFGVDKVQAIKEMKLKRLEERINGKNPLHS